MPGPDTGAGPAGDEAQPPPERTLGIQLGAGLNARLGGDTSGIPEEEPVGLAYGLGVWFAPARVWSIGLSYQRTGLGAGETSGGETSVAVQRDLDTFWLGGRAYPLRSDTIGLYVALALGASWQSLSASGSRSSGVGGVNPPEPFACNASDGPGFALGGGVGVDVDMTRHVAFLAEVGGSGHQLTSDPIENCASGSGSVTGIGATIGFMYRFDLDDRSAPQSARR
jgi:opacity protein-like surface antigen